MKICDYGCEKEAKYQLKNGKWCCEKSSNKCSQVKLKNSNGLKRAYKEGRKKNDHNKGKPSWKKGKVTDFFTLLLIERGNKCEECGIENWNGKKIKLEKHHKNGKNQENTKENIMFLCPNCHSQTNNFRGRNTYSYNGKNGKKVSDEILIEAIKISKNISQALIKVGMSPRGANYSRVKNLKIKYNI